MDNHSKFYLSSVSCKPYFYKTFVSRKDIDSFRDSFEYRYSFVLSSDIVDSINNKNISDHSKSYINLVSCKPFKKGAHSHSSLMPASQMSSRSSSPSFSLAGDLCLTPSTPRARKKASSRWKKKWVRYGTRQEVPIIGLRI